MSAPTGDAELNEFGYTNKLKRSLGGFHTFAAGVSYISVLTGTFQLSYFGLSSGGPAYWWSWPLVFLGQLMVALSFAELASHYPIAGSVYNWSKKLGGQHVGWLAGWMMLLASIVSIAATALAYQHTLPQIWGAFQFIGDGTGTSEASNGVVLATALIVFTTLVNAFGVKLMARINSAGVFIELVAAVLLILFLAVAATRGPEVVMETQNTGSAYSSGYLGAFLVAAIASSYVMYGFDTASSLGEESIDPRRNAPRAILRSLVASFVLGGLIILLALMAARDLNAPELTSDGLQFVLTDALGPMVGRMFLLVVFIAITVCVLAVHTAAIRIAFAMARDNALPGGSKLARVSPRFQTPVTPAIIIGVIAVVLLVVNIGQPQIFSAVTSLAIILIYISYLMVTIPMLVARLRGKWSSAKQEGRFCLGKFGLPVNVLAVLWGLGMTINLAWPRQEVYNAEPPFHWYLQWSSVLFVGIAAGGGFLYYWFVQRHRIGVLAEHAAAPASEPPETTADPKPAIS
ncbi:amino acid/polyamine/organocation transporter (APC superfamily) [Saccharopolyspora erythraea NRRL 2338]|uniref:Amino acid permease-associated region n=2 Tax=Saccharopolyspora erythraea TaxID=1836 RepID=A4FKN5_SACEN|nr:amino acid permease [Saccharopolyspora erythraea]EQD84516.1 amino acid permease [Saccharopolyspora erythraea D]PFG98248.1 amino acid/polyamine/organocation transporter (APC superfamily) [Saccharopolyspora erythraea NRRL 2338]QRK88344.1 amino acid permease [Saccharopolyspora erythraea]CAM04610.1 amino acid permease-associated region [Saccharopolyspora erythraea NRRL 2338]